MLTKHKKIIKADLTAKRWLLLEPTPPACCSINDNLPGGKLSLWFAATFTGLPLALARI